MNLERELMQANERRDAAGRCAPPLRARDRVATHRILVVDDCLDLADVMRLLLAYHGHVVVMACDARSVLKVVESFDPDVVLLDAGMHDEDGHAVIEKLRQHPNVRHARLVAVSGWGHGADVDRGGDHDVTDSLLESVLFDSLLEIIALTPRRADAA